MKKILIYSGALLAVMFSVSSSAIEFNELNGFAAVGYEFGGAKYVTGTYVPSGITENAYANDGLHLMLGASIPNNAAKTFDTQVAIGYKFGGPNGDRSGIVWNTIPLEIIEYYRQGDWRTGLGLSYHVNTRVIAQSINQPSETFRVDNGLGLVGSLVYAPTVQNYAMEVRYTYLRQTFSEAQDKIYDGSIKASVFGLFLHYRF
jgi:hypothetical protein